jgi:hypothetical protein
MLPTFSNPAPDSSDQRLRFLGESTLKRETADIHFFRVEGVSGLLSWLFSLRGEEADPADFMDVRKRMVLERPRGDIGDLGDSHSGCGECD